MGTKSASSFKANTKPLKAHTDRHKCCKINQVTVHTLEYSKPMHKQTSFTLDSTYIYKNHALSLHKWHPRRYTPHVLLIPRPKKLSQEILFIRYPIRKETPHNYTKSNCRYRIAQHYLSPNCPY